MKNINLNFAANETKDGAWDSLKLIISGPQENSLQVLNSKLATIFKTKKENVFTFLSARAALKLFLESLKLDENSEILVLGFTCEAVVLPILENKLKPIYVDLEEESLSFDYDLLLKKISAKTKAIILQHSFGMTPKNREKIIQLTNKKKILVIEDLAHGFHPTAFHEETNTLKLLSFGRSKLLSVVHGGAMILPSTYENQNFKNLYDNLDFPEKKFINKTLFYKILSPILKIFSGTIFLKAIHFLLNKMKIFTKEISENERNGNYDSWLEYKFPKEFASLLIKQVDHYPETIKKRTEITEIYMNFFGDQFSSKPILRYPLLVNDADAVIADYQEKNIFLGNWYRQVVAPTGLDLEKVQYQKGTCPKAETICKQIVNLPTNISKEEAEWIIDLYDKQ